MNTVKKAMRPRVSQKHLDELPAMPRLTISEESRQGFVQPGSGKRQKGICCVTNDENHIRR
jgi:hypothetical protein